MQLVYLLLIFFYGTSGVRAIDARLGLDLGLGLRLGLGLGGEIFLDGNCPKTGTSS